MREYIESILHQNVQIAPFDAAGKLPLAYSGLYELQLITINSHDALLAAPVEKISLTDLRKQQQRMTVVTGLPCVLYLRDLNYYARDTLVKEGIPFVWEGHQVYLPFLGVLLDDYKRQTIRTQARISFLTQKLLLTALYRGWQGITVTKAAQALDVSKMSITRCFDELEAFGVPYLTVRSRARSLTADPDRKAMWEALQGILRTPVITSYALRERPDRVFPLSGLSALAHYSMLEDGTCPVLAITKKDLPAIDLSRDRIAPAGEAPGCLIQELGYHIPFENGVAVDPLSVALSISEEDKADPRVSMAIDEMLEEHVW